MISSVATPQPLATLVSNTVKERGPLLLQSTGDAYLGATSMFGSVSPALTVLTGIGAGIHGVQALVDLGLAGQLSTGGSNHEAKLRLYHAGGNLMSCVAMGMAVGGCTAGVVLPLLAAGVAVNLLTAQCAPFTSYQYKDQD